MINAERIAAVRRYFTDELSLRIFEQRAKNGEDMRKTVFPDTIDLVESQYHSREELLHLVNELRSPKRETFIYGAGGGCQALLYASSGRALGMTGVAGIIDNHVQGEKYGYPVMTFAEFLKKHNKALVVNSVGFPAGKQLHQQCIEAGVEVLSLFECEKSWDQYFDLPAKLGLVSEGEVFVHAGCFNGDTQKSFINWFGTSYERMITFEPSETQYAFCENVLKPLPNVELVKAGLSDAAKIVRFNLNQPGASAISDDGSEDIQTVALDEYMAGQKVTFIALDVEGEEYRALLGSKKIICEQKPKLAISIYHKPEDLYELPELIKRLRPDYQLYLRHYHLLDMAETVLYAF